MLHASFPALGFPTPAYSVSEGEWKRLKTQSSGFGEVLRALLDLGYSESHLRKNAQLLRAALCCLPDVSGVELDGLIREEIEQIKKLKGELKAQYEKLEAQFALIKEEYKKAEADLPSRESRVKQMAHSVDELRFDLYNRQQAIQKKEEELRELSRKIEGYETPQARDQVRKANEYMKTVPQSQWTDKAIAWSLGAILSGTQIPNFGGEK